MFICLEARPGPASSGGGLPATIEEIQGIVASLSKVVKGLVGAIFKPFTLQKQQGHRLLRLNILLFLNFYKCSQPSPTNTPVTYVPSGHKRLG